MPAGMRGDFVYVDGQRIVSNRVALKSGIRFAKPSDPQSMLRQITQQRRGIASYPPTGGSGGPYIRNYSAQGVNAALGYATIPCDSAFSGGDNGFMYFNSYTADSSGSVLDAGLSVDATITAHAFINNQGTYLYSGWTDENYTWACGQHLGIMYGTLYGSGYNILMVGIPSYDPTVFLLPPTSSTWTHGAWNFFPSPSVLTSGSGQWNGIQSPCMGCSVAKMFTISPANTTNDTSCFGLCSINQVPDGRWDQVVMGELILPCSQTQGQSATCTIEYTTNGSWYGALNTGGGGSKAATGNIVYSNNDVNQGLEGIEMGRAPVNYGSSGYQVPAGTFQTLIPIPTPQPTIRPKCPTGCACTSITPGQPLVMQPNVPCPQ